MAAFRFRKRGSGSQDPQSITTSSDDSSVTQTDLTSDQVNENGNNSNNAAIKQATKTRRNAVIFACFCYLVAVVFLIVVEVGNTPGSGARQNIYFFKLDLANIVAQSLPPGLTLTNSIARTLGLHDFYQVGLWNYCEGYFDEGITHCSTPQKMYWFNPVEILMSQLFSEASIALPSEVNDILNILQLASHIMFGCFLAALCLSFVLIITSPIVLSSRLWSGVLSVFALIDSLLIIVGSAVGTAMGIVAQVALSSKPELNVSAELGVTMYVLMWMAAGFSVLAFFVHAGMCCCCTSRRDIRTGRKSAGGSGAAGDKTNTGFSNEKHHKGYSLPHFHRSHRRNNGAK